MSEFGFWQMAQGQRWIHCAFKRACSGAHKVCRNWHDAEECAQEALVKVLTRFGHLGRDFPGGEEGFCGCACALACWIARGKWRHDRELRMPEPEPPKRPDELAEQEQQKSWLRTRLAKVPEPFRTAVVLRFYKGLSLEEIAKELNVSVPTAHRYVKKALNELLGRGTQDSDTMDSDGNPN